MERVELLVEERERGVAGRKLRADGRVLTDAGNIGRAGLQQAAEVRVQLGCKKTADRVGERERPNAIRLCDRERAHPPAPHRLTDEIDLLDADRVEDRREVACRVAEAPAVPGDDAVPGGHEDGDLLEPRRVRAARAVGQHDGVCGRLSGYFVIERFTAVIES